MSILAPGKEAMVFLSTTSSRQEAERVVRTLVEEGLVACGNIVGPITSIYRWKGALCNEPEHLVILKTQRAQMEAMAARLKALHTYECPEILGLAVETGYEAYLSWLSGEEEPGEEKPTAARGG
jgi:periplasmic divalent cation tolerance protein